VLSALCKDLCFSTETKQCENFNKLHHGRIVPCNNKSVVMQSQEYASGGTPGL
jgi:hypothetical protein